MKLVNLIQELAENMIDAMHFDDDPKTSVTSLGIVAILATYLVAAGIYLLITMIKAGSILWLLNIIIGVVAVPVYTFGIIVYCAMIAILLNKIKSDESDYYD
jgi:hypothetical protein